ncbi:MAG TPA: hypothetical protein VJU61_22820, partial [Polyangiaceae bacterium]|nr:hypothetical protein [Polyangiaceae bacterium]
ELSSSEPLVVDAALDCGVAQGSACCASSSSPCAAGLGCESGVCVRCAAFSPVGLFPGHLDATVGALSGDGRVAIGVGWLADGAVQAVRWLLDIGTAELLSPLANIEPLAVSSTGSVIVGQVLVSDVRSDAFIWTEAEGVTILAADAVATGVSADGSVVVGRLYLPGDRTRAFRWTAAGGLVELERSGAPYSDALAISPDGSITVGSLADEAGNDRIASWGPRGLRLIEPSSASAGRATGVNADGSVIVGMHLHDGIASVFRWTEAGGIADLGLGVARVLVATTRSGATVAAVRRSRAQIWRSDTGELRPLEDTLQGLVPEGWVLFEAGISADGRVLAGRGRSPYNRLEGWVARLGPRCAAPEP